MKTFWRVASAPFVMVFGTVGMAILTPFIIIGALLGSLTRWWGLLVFPFVVIAIALVLAVSPIISLLLLFGVIKLPNWKMFDRFKKATDEMVDNLSEVVEEMKVANEFNMMMYTDLLSKKDIDFTGCSTIQEVFAKYNVELPTVSKSSAEPEAEPAS